MFWHQLALNVPLERLFTYSHFEVLPLGTRVVVTFRNKRGIRCLTAAHCHQDETKISKYESLYSSVSERFFTDPQKAEAWIRSAAQAPS